MDAIVYVALIATLTVTATILPRLDKPCVALVACVLIVFSGARSRGFDHAEYLTMIAVSRGGENVGLAEFMGRAKDPLFGLVVYLIDALRGEDALVLVTMAALAGITKLGFAWGMPGGRTLFLGFYAVFLAPGLEFAAVRAAVGIGFLGLAVTTRESVVRRTPYLVLAVASHLSLIACSLFALSRWRLTARCVATVIAIVTTVTLFVVGVLVLLPNEMPRLADYQANRGTPLALILPTCTVAVLLFGAKLSLIRNAAARDPAIGAAYRVAMGMAAAALGAAAPIVTMSTRLLEVAWFFGLYVILRLAGERASTRARLAVAALAVFLAAVNIERGTWAAMAALGILGE